MRPPTFDEAAFVIDEKEDYTINIKIQK
jgi:hypothetical protein